MADTLAIHDSYGRDFGVALRGSQTFSGQPFADHHLIYFNQQAGALGIVKRNEGTGEVAVVEIAPGNDTVLEARVRVPLVPLERQRVEAAIAAKMRSITEPLRSSADTLATSTVYEMVEAALYVPDHLPPVTSVVTTASNEVWLRSGESHDSLAIWYVIDRTDPTAMPRHVLLPEEFRLGDATHTHVWGLHVDARYSGQVQGRRLVPISE
ncbi:MAG: hypothetical protein OXE96_08620 [Gemmatimonadetes bacterium]|nr:hypothetical protein [Gemmatimonadota bacterium]